MDATHALADLRGHLRWLRERDALAADRLSEDVRRAERLLSEHPRSGHAVDGTALRVMLTTRYRYRLVHRARTGKVVVVRMLHARQR